MAIRKRLSLLSAYLRKKTVVDVYPSVIGVETTNYCNLDCIMCPRMNMTRSEVHMNLDIFKKIIDDISGKVEFAWLQGYGEPILHKNIFEMISYAKNKGVKTGISSNATALTGAVVDRLLESGLDYIILAMDGVTKETYERVRVGGDFEAVTRNINRLIEAKNRKRSGLYIVLQLIYMEETENEVRDFLNLWNVKGVNGVRIRQVTFSGNYGKFKNRLDNRPCYWLWSDPHINSDGTVVPCCQDVNGEWPLGNISEKPLGEIWNCDDMIRLRQAHIDGGFRDIPLCKECNMYQPAIPFVIAGAFFNYFTINRLVPMVETQIALRRFSGNDKKMEGARS